MLTDNIAFYVGAAALFVACLVKVPSLLRSPHDALLRSACALLFVGGCDLLLVAPDTIATMNRLTGVTNFSAPLVYIMLSAFSGASVVLLVNWRGGQPDRTRRTSRTFVTVYSLVIAAIAGLFWAGSTPREELVDFDTVYATTPYIREMIVLYLVSHGVASTMASLLCWRWAVEVRGTFRVGLRILGTAYVLHVIYDVTKMLAVTARWFHTDWDVLSRDVAPVVAAPSAVLVGTGFLLPLLSRRVSDTLEAIRHLRLLAPLASELGTVTHDSAHHIAISRWSPAVRLRLTQRKTSISDGILQLSPYFDEEIRTAALNASLARGDSEDQARAVADAAVLVAAAGSRRADPDAADAAPQPEVLRVGERDLLPLAQALSSPVVHAIRQRTPAP
ncbi:MAB_1171c family putative transporter [Streptomyces sp. NBC_01304]|uniref:MAB_1171c family putative transporter n=1 Tax=Streptomyces sp. NBC_01304 TaxID=2903818 RepID=UPI002E15EA92|nr:hypothetical protein OG430_41425 [Streptomyces sp. NBC_01304]